MNARPNRFARASATILILAISGCGGDRAYPQVEAVSPLGKSAKCNACDNEIPSVTQEHLFSFQGIQYTVCNESCAVRLKDDIEHDRQPAHEH